MREFFRGWQRKTGLALLAMALLLTVAWFRSVGIRDRVVFDTYGIHHIVCSSEGKLDWFRYVDPNMGKVIPQWSSDNLAPEDQQKTFMLDGDVIRFTNETNWRILGVGYRAGEEFEDRRCFRQWAVQYWLFILPLTLLSAWLILAKPRPAKTAKEPKHD